MKPSISMLAWYLREFQPVSSIRNDKPTINGVRFLADETVMLSPDYVYVGAAVNFISDEKYDSGYIVVHGQDFLLLNGTDFDILLNKLLSALDFYDDWETRLRAAAERVAPLREYVALGEEVMGDFFVICDMGTNLLASSRVDPRDTQGTTWEYFFSHKRVSPTSLNSPIRDDRGEQMAAHPYPRRVVSENPAVPDLLSECLFQDDEPIAYVAVNQTKESPTQMQMQVLPVFCRYLVGAAEFTTQGSVVQSRARIFAGLLRGEMPGEKLLERFVRRIGGGAFRILHFNNLIREDFVHANVFVNYLRSQELLCCHSGKGVAALIGEEGWEDRLKAILRSSGFSGVRCGVSMPAEDVSAIPVRHKQAEFAALRAPREEGIYLCRDYAFSYLLDVLRQNESAGFLLHPALDILEEYDRENQNELLPTLNEYLKNNNNLQKTLESLNIHRSTLKYRLKRIEDLTGVDFSDPAEESYLRLSLWLRFNN